MDSPIVRSLLPEEQELEEKRQILSRLEIQLADQELSLATLRAELERFGEAYRRRIGTRYAELDDLLAQIAELESLLNPKNDNLKAQASEARRRANETADEAGKYDEVSLVEYIPPFQPSTDLKKLFREVAKKVHPDLATSDEDRIRRTKFMAEANDAYEHGDEDKLKQILENWLSSPDNISGDGIANELIRVIRKIRQVEVRLRLILQELASLKQSDLYGIMEKVNEATRNGIGLLQQMQDDIYKEIAEAWQSLEFLRIKLKSRGVNFG